MMNKNQEKFYSIIKKKYPMMLKGVLESRNTNEKLVDKYFDTSLGWFEKVFGEDIFEEIADSYSRYTIEVNRSQVAYEKRGHYEFSKFEDANKRVYQNNDYMEYYYLGIYAILFAWSHYVEIMEFYLEAYLPKIKSGRLLEIAPGHGLWGIIPLYMNENIFLDAWDISPTALTVAPKIAEAAGISERCSYKIGDAMQIDYKSSSYDFGLCSFMLEHLEDPQEFLNYFSKSIKKGGYAFITLALTASQQDHIYEFINYSEAIIMIEIAGFELIESRSAQPLRVMPNASKLPRIQGLIVRKL